jgi:hypothetical protein
MTTVNVYVRRVGTGEIEHTMPVPLPCSEGRQERMVMGMLRNMNTEEFYVDDSEIDTARAKAAKAGKVSG